MSVAAPIARHFKTACEKFAKCRMPVFGRRFIASVLLTAAIVGLCASGPAIAAGTVSQPKSDSASPAANCVRMVTVPFHSTLIGKILPYNVILPVGYDESTTRYPVLYLLHGLSGHYNDWLDQTNLADYAAAYKMIIVMPEAENSWYIDSAVNPADKYESYIISELIPDVDGRFRTIPDRRSRAIAGLSMGGYGAFKFGIKYPDMFVFAASMSGALDVQGLDRLKGTDPFTRLVTGSLNAALGPVGDSTRAQNDIFELLTKLPASQIPDLPFFYLDCGTEDGLIRTNHAMDRLLLARHIPHMYEERPGIHDWTEWDAQIQQVLPLAARLMTIYGD